MGNILKIRIAYFSDYLDLLGIACDATQICTFVWLYKVPIIRYCVYPTTRCPPEGRGRYHHHVTGSRSLKIRRFILISQQHPKSRLTRRHVLPWTTSQKAIPSSQDGLVCTLSPPPDLGRQPPLRSPSSSCPAIRHRGSPACRLKERPEVLSLVDVSSKLVNP